MCGIFGFSGRHPADVTKLSWLAVENESRGRHSTGVYTKKNNKQQTTSLYKDVVAAEAFIQHLGWQDAVSGAIIAGGHTRAATKGAVSQANAHPYRFDFEGGTECVGAHNGFVFDNLDGKPQHEHFGFEKEFTVDSELIFAVLSKYGGDYKKLSEIEGGIACWFTLPKKYPDHLFLYKGQARDLAVGFAPEGLYFSSEKRPLKLIGCSKVNDVPDHHLMIVKNGQIVDLVPMEKQKIRLHHNAQRTTAQNFMTVDEKKRLGFNSTYTPVAAPAKGLYEDYDYETNSWKRPEAVCYKKKSKTSTFPSSSTPQASANDQCNLIINDVVREVKDLIPSPAQLASTLRYNFNEFDGSFLFLKLHSSKGNSPLAAWAIWDKEDTTINCITTLDGYAALEYPTKYCGGYRTILMTDPMEEGLVYEHTITINAESVLEVMLSMPFPQEAGNKTAGDTSANKRAATTQALNCGDAKLNALPDKLKQVLCDVPSSGEANNLLQKEAKQICIRYAGEEAPWETGQGESGKDTSSGSKELHPRAYMGLDSEDGDDSTGTGSRVGLVIPKLSITSVKAILKNEREEFKYKSTVKKFMLGNEYTSALSIYLKTVAGYVDYRRVLGDACILKIHQLSLHTTPYSLMFYGNFLMKYMVENYQIGQLGEDRLAELNNELKKLSNDSWANNIVTQEVVKEKKEFGVLRIIS